MPEKPRADLEVAAPLTTYTAFCQDADGSGTIWISEIQAPDVATARGVAVIACASDWDQDPDHVHCLGIAQGNVQILYWQDIGD